MAGRVYTTEYKSYFTDDGTMSSMKKGIGDMTKELNKLQVGTDEFNKLAAQIGIAENELRQMQAAATAATGGVKEFGNANKRLSDFIKEQRHEGWNQSFLFRNIKGSVGAAGIALTAFGVTAEGSMKQVSDSMNTGFVAMQGVDFALASLGVAGPWGLAIAGAAGLAAAFLKFGEPDVEKAKKQLQDIEAILSRNIAGATVREAKAMFESITNAMLELETQRKAIENSVKPASTPEAMSSSGIVLGEKTWQSEQKLTKEQIDEIARLDKAYQELAVQLKVVKALLPGATEEYKKSVEERLQRGKQVADKRIEIEREKYAALLSITKDGEAKSYLEEMRTHEARVATYKRELVLYPELQKQINQALEMEERRHWAVIKNVSLGGYTPIGRGGTTAINNDWQMKKRPDALGSELSIIQEGSPEMMMGVSALESGFMSLGNTIQLQFIDKMLESQDIATRFVGGVLSGIEQIAMKMASAALGAGFLSLLTGGSFGALFGGLSGLGGSTESEAKKRLSPLTSFQGGGMNESITINVTGLLEGENIYFANQKVGIRLAKTGRR